VLFELDVTNSAYDAECTIIIISLCSAKDDSAKGTMSSLFQPRQHENADKRRVVAALLLGDGAGYYQSICPARGALSSKSAAAAVER